MNRVVPTVWLEYYQSLQTETQTLEQSESQRKERE